LLLLKRKFKDVPSECFGLFFKQVVHQIQQFLLLLLIDKVFCHLNRVVFSKCVMDPIC
jgi:hypothetical protein